MATKVALARKRQWRQRAGNPRLRSPPLSLAAAPPLFVKVSDVFGDIAPDFLAPLPLGRGDLGEIFIYGGVNSPRPYSPGFVRRNFRFQPAHGDEAHHYVG